MQVGRPTNIIIILWYRLSNNITCSVRLLLYFFPGLFFTFFSYFGSLLVVWGFGVGVLISGFWGWGFQLMEFGACGVGAFWFFWVGALFKHERITLGKNGARLLT